MTHGREDMVNMGMSADARTFSIQTQIEQPVDGLVVSVDDKADFPYTVERIHYRIDAGSCDMIPAIDGVPIDTTESDSSGLITVDSPTGSDAFTDTSLDLVPEGGALLMTLSNTDSAAANLRVKFTCRRDLTNVDRSDDV